MKIVDDGTPEVVGDPTQDMPPTYERSINGRPEQQDEEEPGQDEAAA